MLEDAADGVKRGVGHPGITVAGKGGLAILPDADVGVHAGAVVLEQGFGHEGHGVAIAGGHVFQDILEPHELVSHEQQRLEAHVDFGLAGGGHLMVLALHGNAQLFQDEQHFGAQILELVHGRYGEIALFVAGFISQVGAFVTPRIPDALHGVDFIEGPVARRLEANFVENEEFCFGADEGRVADAGAFEIGFGLLGDVARIPGVGLTCDGVDDVAHHHEGRDFEKGVHFGGGRIGNDEHITGVDGLPAANTGAVKTETVFEAGFVQFAHGNREVLPNAGEIQETDIHNLGAFFLCKSQYVFGCHDVPPC